LAGVGQTSVNQLGAAGQNYANTVGSNYLNQAVNAGNAGMIGANALTSGLTGALSTYGRSPVSFSSLYGGNSPGTNMTQQEYAIASGGY
jgi:hypothetical protein